MLKFYKEVKKTSIPIVKLGMHLAIYETIAFAHNEVKGWGAPSDEELQTIACACYEAWRKSDFSVDPTELTYNVSFAYFKGKVDFETIMRATPCELLDKFTR